MNAKATAPEADSSLLLRCARSLSPKQRPTTLTSAQWPVIMAGVRESMLRSFEMSNYGLQRV